jgi:uncharacterized membrane protein
MEQNRFKSKVLWGTLISLVVSMMVTLDVIQLPVSKAIEDVGVAILNLLVVVGILNNPTDAKDW